jgi:hypothetical protein
MGTNPSRRLSVAGASIITLFAGQAYGQYYKYPYLEAECPDTFAGAYGNRLTSTGGYSGSGYVRSVGNTSASSYNGLSDDFASYEFSLREQYLYQIWIRVNTNGSAADDSLFVRMDGGMIHPWITVNNIPSTSGWQWYKISNTFPIDPGDHYIEIANREDGLLIDKIAVLPYGGPAPTGTGQPAYNCAAPLYFEAECRKGAWGDYQLDRTQKSGFSGTGYLESTVTATSPEPLQSEATYFFESGTGNYDFYFRVNTNANGNDDSWYYKVDNGSWVEMNGASSLGSGWRWSKGTSGAYLEHGKHQLQVRNRENGLSLDKLAFVPSALTGPSGTGAGSAAVNCEPFQKMTDWGPAEVEEYMMTLTGYFLYYGMDLAHHAHWHDHNGLGGMDCEGSGIAFLGFHRAMLNDFRKWALMSNGRSWLPIDTVGEAVPPTMEDSQEILFLLGRSEEYQPREAWSIVNYGVPAYLTVSATSHPEWDDTQGLGGLTFARLNDFPDLDTLGRTMGNYYHIQFHMLVGGTMENSAISPTEPLFFGWHGFLDRIVTNWLGTPSGQAWISANSGHPFLGQGFTDMTIWDNADWRPPVFPTPYCTPRAGH